MGKEKEGLADLGLMSMANSDIYNFIISALILMGRQGMRVERQPEERVADEGACEDVPRIQHHTLKDFKRQDR